MVEAVDKAAAESRPAKSAAAFRTISEVAGELDLPQHVLRFWETKFPSIRPLKRGGGRRYYRPEDVVLLRRIRDLLYAQGYTIKGVQKLIRHNGQRGDGETGGSPAAGAKPSDAAAGENRRRSLTVVLKELEDLRDLVDAHSR
jgi:DNA-binding transcriptional MerR regulator